MNVSGGTAAATVPSTKILIMDDDGAQCAGAGRRWAKKWLRSILIGIGLFMLIRTFALEASRIPSGSMENTLLSGDFVLVNKAFWGFVPRTPIRGRPVVVYLSVDPEPITAETSWSDSSSWDRIGHALG